MDPVYDDLVRILTGPLELPADLMSPETTFGQLELDSLAVEELQMLVLDKFGVELWDEGAHATEQTLGEAVRHLSAERHLV